MGNESKKRPLIPGPTVVLRGCEFVLPPLTGAHLEDYETEFSRVLALDKMKTPVPIGEDLKAFVTLAHAALKENYPDISRDDVRRLLDGSNFLAVYTALLGVSGFEKKEGKGSPAGETTPAS